MKPLIGIACSIEESGFTVGTDYARAVHSSGGIPVALPPVIADELVPELLERLDGLLLSGGDDVDPVHYGEEILPENGQLEPERDRVELALAREALRRGVPILGICRGMQVLNVAAGGSLYQDIPSQTSTRLQHRQRAPRWYATHGITIRPASVLAAAFGVTATRVNSFHHQAVRRVAPGFAVTAQAPDGIIEGIEAEGHPFAVGVQWHPECLFERDPLQAALFRAFIAAAERRSAARAGAGEDAV